MIYLLGNVGEWRNEANARNATSRAETESKLMPGNKSSYSIQNLICNGKKHYMCVYTFLTPAKIIFFYIYLSSELIKAFDSGLVRISFRKKGISIKYLVILYLGKNYVKFCNP